MLLGLSPALGMGMGMVRRACLGLEGGLASVELREGWDDDCDALENV